MGFYDIFQMLVYLCHSDEQEKIIIRMVQLESFPYTSIHPLGYAFHSIWRHDPFQDFSLP